MKKTLLFAMLMLSGIIVFSQKKNYDIVSYTAPDDWKEEKGTGFIAYSRVDGGSWSQIAIYQHTASAGDITTNFDKEWEKLLAVPNKINATPQKTAPQTVNGWTRMSGSGSWTHESSTVASVLTVFSNNKVVVSVLCNATAQPYFKEYQNVIASVVLAHKEETRPAATSSSVSGKLAGQWEFYMNETSGTFSNGVPMTTGGYFRREYRLNTNGSYEFLEKKFSAYNKVIFFSRETGTWAMSGNQLTIRPKQGKNEEWSKSASGRNEEWGKLIRVTNRKLETVTYTFELRYLSGMEQTYLVLTANTPTVRDGRESNDNNRPHQFTYSPGTPGKFLIGLPPDRK